MDNLDLMMTLQAYKEGRPIQKGNTMRVDISEPENALLISFLRMGGESTPWGIAVKKPDGDLKVFSVPDPRKRTELSLMLRQFWRYLREQIESFKFLDDSDHFQIWLPNSSHLDMFHYLALRYIFTKYEPEGPEFRGMASDLRGLGRFCNWVFQESQRPGQTTIVLATQALKESFFFPADNLRQAHLGFLLSWLRDDVDKAERFALAEEAEKVSISATLAPEIESDFLEKLVAAYGGHETPQAAKDKASGSISKVLSRELVNRVDLVERAYNLLMDDERDFNPGLDDLRKASKSDFAYSYTRIEGEIADGGTPFIKGVETDKSYKAAVRGYLEKEEASTVASNALLPYDEYLQQKAISAGDAIEGELVLVEKTKVGRATYIRWEIHGTDINPLRIREGNTVYFSGLPKSSLVLDEVEALDGGRIYRLSVLSPKTTRGGFDMADKKLEGQTVLLFSKPYVGSLFGKFKVIFKPDLPGDWLLKRVSGK